MHCCFLQLLFFFLCLDLYHTWNFPQFLAILSQSLIIKWVSVNVVCWRRNGIHWSVWAENWLAHWGIPKEPVWRIIPSTQGLCQSPASRWELVFGSQGWGDSGRPWALIPHVGAPSSCLQSTWCAWCPGGRSSGLLHVYRVEGRCPEVQAGRLVVLLLRVHSPLS